jgi:sialidase-1
MSLFHPSTTLLLCLLLPIVFGQPSASNEPPLRATRKSFAFEWCDCETGANNVTVWPIMQDGNKDVANKIIIGAGKAPLYIEWKNKVKAIGWVCSNMKKEHRSTVLGGSQVWSVQLKNIKKPFPCSKASGRLHVVTYDSVSYNTSIVFSSGEGGYECIKIPVLLRTLENSLLAFAEARKHSCSDFAWTDLVVKRSVDNGLTWSPLLVVRSESGPGLPHTVIGNAAPVQLKASRKILVPHTSNNSIAWCTASTDDGQTWSKAASLENVTKPEWKWIGTGPPGSVELENGRILVPSYHSKYRGNLINNIVHGHVIVSDDEGESWRLGATQFGEGDKCSNECQAVQLNNGSVLINARSFATLTKQKRIQTLSNDGGLTFGPTRWVDDLPQPFDGCEGSMIRLPQNGSLYFSGPDSYLKRDHLTVWKSENEGLSWETYVLVDPGASGYSSLQTHENVLELLYEQSDEDDLIMAPDRFVYRVVV